MARPFQIAPSTAVHNHQIKEQVISSLAKGFGYDPSLSFRLVSILGRCLLLVRSLIGSSVVFLWTPQSFVYAQKAESGSIIFADDEDEETQDDSEASSPDTQKGEATVSDDKAGKKTDPLVGPPSPKGSQTKLPNGTSAPLNSDGEKDQRPSLLTKTSEPRIFGEYRVRLGASKPTFSSDLKYYDTLYGATSFYPSISADWFAFDWYATFGISLRSGFYTDEGKAGRGKSASNDQTLSKDDITSENIQVDKDASTTLTLLPFQVAAIVQFTPFDYKWLVLDGWFGMERLYFQEVRAGSSTSTAMISTASDSDSVFTNNGFKNAVLYGFGANIRIDALDESTHSSLGAIGLHAVYLTPSVEVVQQTDKGVNFSRRVTSLAFVFESIL